MSARRLIHRVAGMAIRYGLVGAACTLLNLAIVWAGTERVHLPYPLAALSTCFVTIPIAYLLHRRLSFRKRGRADRGEWWRFLTLQFSQFCAGLAGMAAAIQLLHMRPWIAMAMVSAVMFAYGFVVSGTWVFSSRYRPGRSWNADATAPLRVLQVSTFFATHMGGLEVVADQLAHRLAREGVRLTWMAGAPPNESPPAAENLTIERADYVDFVEHRLGLPAPIWSLGSLRRLWGHVGKCEVVHVHDYLYLPSLAAMMFARLRGRPLVLTQHIGEIPFESRIPRLVLQTLNRTLGRWMLSSAAQVAFVGKPVQDHFARFVRFKRAPALIANGVDHTLYRPRPIDSPILDAELRALFVGRFVEKKGIGLLQRCATMPGVRWDFAGLGPMLDEAWASRHPSVRLLGRLEPAAVADAMRNADVLVLPSRGEGFPLVVQEALSCGTPVLVSQAVADAFPRLDERCVWSVDLTDGVTEAAERLRACIAALRDDLPRVRRAREPARQLAAQWSWDECVAAYQRIYKQLAVGQNG